MADRKNELICISCPRGCLLKVSGQGESLEITGNFCSKGIDYARKEITEPVRVLTVLMRPEGGGRPVSVKTDRPVPKDMLKKCAAEIYRNHPQLPIRSGDVLIKDLCGTGADVVATSTLK